MNKREQARKTKSRGERKTQALCCLTCLELWTLESGPLDVWSGVVMDGGRLGTSGARKKNTKNIYIYIKIK